MATKGKSYTRSILISTVILIIVLLTLVYQETRPTIIIHTHTESGYLGKVSKIDGCIDKLYVKNHKVNYRLPHIWNWEEQDEIAVFTKNYRELFTKEGLDFGRLDIYLDENGYYESHSSTGYFFSKFYSKK